MEHALRRSVPCAQKTEKTFAMDAGRSSGRDSRGGGGNRVLIAFVNRFERRFSLGGGKPIFQFRGNKSMSEQRKTYADLKDELLITRDQIAVRVKEMGAEITRDFEGKDLTVICILKGAVVFFVDLIREIDLPMTMDFHGDFQLWQRDQVLRRGAHPQVI